MGKKAKIYHQSNKSQNSVNSNDDYCKQKSIKNISELETTARVSRKITLAYIGIILFSILFSLVLGFLPVQSIRAEENSASTNENSGTFRVGMEANYSPFNWSQASNKNSALAIINSPGEFVNGYDLWMAEEIARGLGLKLEVVKIEWDGLVPALISGKIDAIIAGMSPTTERKEVIDFTESYYSSDLVMVIKKGSEYENAQSIQDFSHAKVTAQLNTFHYEVLEQIKGLEPQIALDSFPTMISSLLSGKLDAYVSERPGAMAAVAANPSLKYLSFEGENAFKTNTEDTSIAIGLKKNSVLKDSINKILSEISEDSRQAAMQKMINITSGKEKSEEAEKSFLVGTYTILQEYWPLFLRGSLITLLIATVSTIVGFIIGLLVQVVREIPNKTYSPLFSTLIRLAQWFLTAYVEIFRSTPMMVQAMLIYYGSKLFLNIDMSSMFAALLIVSINTGAYMAEVVRGGISSVDKGQFEACKSIGLSHWQSMRLVILPQTIKSILPTIGNEFVVNIKDSAVLNVISVTELFFVTKSVAGTTLQIFHTYFLTALIYFVLTFASTRVINWTSRRTGSSESFSLASVSAYEKL